MRCAKCQEPTVVCLTRTGEAGEPLRRRLCMFCGNRFWTHEVDQAAWERLTVGQTTRKTERRQASIETAERDRLIVFRVTQGEKRHLLAEEYGLSPAYVSRICIKAGLPANKRFKRVR